MKMPLNAEVKRIIEEYGKQQLPEFSTPEQAREQLMKIYKPDNIELPLAKIKGFTVPGPEGEIAIRVYWPEGKSPLPALIYFGGGGFVIGNLNTCDERCQLLAYFTGCIIVSVNYSRAPEHPFPAAVEDGYAVLQWLQKNVKRFGVDPEKIGVCGENAGGNIAASLCLMSRDRQGPSICYQMLIYPMLDNRLESKSQQEFATGYLLTQTKLKWYWGHYLFHPSNGDNSYAVPLRAQNLSHLPPAQIITAEFDPLRDEAEEYANRLRDASVPVHYHCYQGLVHGFLGMYSSVEKVNLVLSDMCDKVKAILF